LLGLDNSKNNKQVNIILIRLENLPYELILILFKQFLFKLIVISFCLNLRLSLKYYLLLDRYMTNYNKYLKYKDKYLKLKNLVGGTKDLSEEIVVGGISYKYVYGLYHKIFAQKENSLDPEMTTPENKLITRSELEKIIVAYFEQYSSGPFLMPGYTSFDNMILRARQIAQNDIGESEIKKMTEVTDAIVKKYKHVEIIRKEEEAAIKSKKKQEEIIIMKRRITNNDNGHKNDDIINDHNNDNNRNRINNHNGKNENKHYNKNNNNNTDNNNHNEYNKNHKKNAN
jgi:hypothetical protein